MLRSFRNNRILYPLFAENTAVAAYYSSIGGATFRSVPLLLRKQIMPCRLAMIGWSNQSPVRVLITAKMHDVELQFACLHAYHVIIINLITCFK